ncbi:PEP-CTERM system TPR-repeat protein PrsT [Aestuariicella sp. G3-2]|uniref:XrtA/PEP-CTERM system TPR-repeat protein PrsT n=1 Tax=Pseudomaricurvus albidus TaxID=2842452 RepID=UPI001C0B0DB8|nr:XrtA/PEP-CTERM system TPR-repeat protein PrsT [Aestuariicella albida]MBU3070867.1 PEP-CTERM system TPR-repeat protein PrsT [Aestuariicella albida]
MRISAQKCLLITVSLLVVVAAPLTAYSQSRLQEFHEDASRLYHEQDYQSSLIQLKNALQINPEHVPSLVLSAEVWIALNNPEAAEDALIKARVLGADRRYTDLKLAEIYREQKKYQSILDELSIRGLKPQQTVDMLGYIAEAQLRLDQEAKAELTIQQAETLIPGALRPNLAQIRLDISRQQFLNAIQLGQQLVERYPQSSEAWNLYASAMHAEGRLQEALKNYAQALQADPENLEARMARIGLLLDMQRTEDTLPDLEYFNQHYPYEPKAAYFRGLVYSRLQQPDNDYAEQSTLQLKNCTEIISQLPSEKVRADQQLSMIAALAHYGLSEFEASKEYLSQYLRKHTKDPGANRLMGDTLIRLNDPLSAIRYLKVAYNTHPEDKQTLELLASAYSQAGHHDQATAFLKELQKNNIDTNSRDTHVDTHLALSMLQTRHFDAGIEQLKAVYQRDPTNQQAGFSLVLALLKDKQYPLALHYAQQLAKHTPKSISTLNLLGVAQQATGDLAAAQATFRAILMSAPDSIPTQINLAKTEYALGDARASRQRLELALTQHPDNLQVMLALARINLEESHSDSGNAKTEEALRLTENAYRLNKDSMDARRLLIEVYLQKHNHDAAEALALDTVSYYDGPTGNRFDASMLLGQVYQQIGKPRKAVSLYKTMTKNAGFNTDTLYQISQRLIQLQSWEAARHALYKALEGNPEHMMSQLDYIRVQLALKEYQGAHERAIAFINKYPANLNGYLLAGESLIQLKQPLQALKFYQAGLNQGFDSRLVLNQASLLDAQRTADKAAALLKHYWQQNTHPSVGAAYSHYLIKEKQWEEAQKTLERLIAVEQDNPGFLNNMAYVLDQRGERQALDFAQKAYQHAPDNPFINDTLGWLLVKSGKPEDGLRYLRQAVVRLSGKPELRYHLGRALFDLGRTLEARQELEQAISIGSDFEGRNDALELLKNLKQTQPITTL